MSDKITGDSSLGCLHVGTLQQKAKGKEGSGRQGRKGKGQGVMNSSFCDRQKKQRRHSRLMGPPPPPSVCLDASFLRGWLDVGLADGCCGCVLTQCCVCVFACGAVVRCAHSPIP